MIHSHSCDDCGQELECSGKFRQLSDHENRFACTEYERWPDYRCETCQKNFDSSQEWPCDFNGPSLAEALERDAKIGRGR